MDPEFCGREHWCGAGAGSGRPLRTGALPAGTAVARAVEHLGSWLSTGRPISPRCGRGGAEAQAGAQPGLPGCHLLSPAAAHGAAWGRSPWGLERQLAAGG